MLVLKALVASSRKRGLNHSNREWYNPKCKSVLFLTDVASSATRSRFGPTSTAFQFQEYLDPHKVKPKKRKIRG